ncbi:ribonuclease H-like domain-containing protein [Tanacetum coccineum]
MLKHSIHHSTFRRDVLGAAPCVLPGAFSAMANRDPTWNMDTGASSHLNSHTSNLNTVYNKFLYPSICVGDGKSIPVTNTGHSILHTLNHPLHLHNVLVTTNIIKNLRDNNCTVEFDAFGFSVKDFLTRHILLRCDSSGDLYPVTSPSPTPHALLYVSFSTWHQRLGHPGEEVLRSLVSRQFISCNKDKSPHVCHACQLGKDVRLLFSSFNSIVSRSFEIVHSYIWTSPIVSSVGFKYKARLVANGRNQQYGVDFSDTFSPVVKLAIIRTVVSLALAQNWHVHQLDVKNSFLNGDLTETVYMYQPPGFKDSRFPHHVCRLQRSLYGLKLEPRAWFQRFAGYALRVGFTSSRCDSSLFIYQQ